MPIIGKPRDHQVEASLKKKSKCGSLCLVTVCKNKRTIGSGIIDKNPGPLLLGVRPICVGVSETSVTSFLEASLGYIPCTPLP